MDRIRQVCGKTVGAAGRRGSAIFMAIIMGIVFFMVVSSLLHYLSGERRQVKHVIGKKQAELLAISGIDWAEQELRQRRWYQEPWGTSVTGGGRPSSGLSELTPFGPGMGKVTVVCEDVPARVPATNIRNMQQLWLLHHINVFSLGEFGDSRCLLYGRFIMSPEPALNDDSTDAVIFADEGTNPGQVAVKLPESGGERFKVTQILCQTGSRVDINQVLIRMAAVSDPSRTVELRPPAHGTVRSVRCAVGDTVSSRDTLVVLGKDGSGGAGRTLKRMVRVTRIDAQPWANFDITDFEDRHALSEYIGVLSEVYLLNYGARPDLQKAAEANRSGGLPKEMTPEEFLQRFPAGVRNTSQDRAENEFLADLLRRFTLTPAKNWPEAVKKLALQLDHPRMDVPPDLRQTLQELGLLNLRDSAPRRDPRLYQPRIPMDEYLDLLRPVFNDDPENFIRKLSELPDASRWIEVLKDPKYGKRPASKKETSKGIQIVKPEDESRITVSKVPKPYDFVDPTSGYQGRVEHVLGFIRKYYSDIGSVLPREPVRNLEFLDWPLPNPPPAPPSPREGGEWVWCPGEPGVPPGLPTWSYKGGKVIEVPFPSGGQRDHEPAGGPPDGGQRSYEIKGVAPTRSGGGGGEGARAPDGSGRMNDDGAGAPVSGGSGDTQGAGAPVSDGGENTSGGRSPDPAGSIFSTNHPVSKIPTDGTFTGTAGPAGIPPKQGEYAWVEPCPHGGSPAGGGGQNAWAQDGDLPGAGQSDGNKLGGETPGGPGTADGHGQDMDGKPAGVDGHGLGQTGKPGQADGSGYNQDGKPGQANGDGTGLDGKPGQANDGGSATTGQPGGATAGQANSPGSSTGTAGQAGSPGSGGRTTGTGPVDTTSPVIKCPKCGKLHKNPNYKSPGGKSGGGGGSGAVRGGC